MTADTWVNTLLVRYQQRDYAGCIAAAEEALRLDPHSEIAYNNQGAAHAALMQWPKAIAAERKAIALKPGFQLAKNNLAAYELASLGKVAPAIPQQTSGRNGAHESAEQFLNESLRFYQANQYRASIAAARQALELRPEFAEAWNNIAASEAAMQHWDEAINAANQAIRSKPDFQLAKNNLAWATAEKAKNKGAAR